MLLRPARHLATSSGRLLSAAAAPPPPPPPPSAPPPPLTAAVLTPERRRAFAAGIATVHSPDRVATDGEPGAAVLVPLCRVSDQPGLLYTLRSSSLNKHAGEVAFPGGNCDPSDADPLATALRETEEEIGLKAERDGLWAKLPPMLSRYGGRPVAAYVVDIGEVRMEALRPQPEEVEDVFFLSFEHLCRPENTGHTQWRRGDASYSLPVFLNGPHRVWGLTAIFTHLVMSFLLPEWYRFKLPFMRPLKDASS